MICSHGFEYEQNKTSSTTTFTGPMNCDLHACSLIGKSRPNFWCNDGCIFCVCAADLALGRSWLKKVALATAAIHYNYIHTYTSPIT